MQKAKKILILSFALVIFFLRANIAQAVDLTVTCANNGSCSLNTTDPLFKVTNMVPGESVNQAIKVTNEDDDEVCNLFMEVTDSNQNPSNFAGQLFTAISQDGLKILGTQLGGEALSDLTIQDIFDASLVNMGTVNTNSTSDYNWIVTFNKNAGNKFQGAQTTFDFKIAFTCGEEIEGQFLLTKANDAGSNSRSPGDAVVYTLTVSTVGNAIDNVLVYDLPPDGFDYRSGSWTANSNIHGDLKSIIQEPTYSSPGTWSLGNMGENEVITLTYTVDINSGQDSGIYPDLAWARGNYNSGTVFANEDTGYFVGTEVKVDTNQPSSIGFNQSQVLGASTEMLPATGSNTLWLVCAGFLFGGGALSLGIGCYLRQKHA